MRARDTDADWHAIGASDPFAGATGNVRLRGTALSEAGRGALLAGGAADIAHTHAMLARHFAPPERFGHGLDFGCGVGRHLAAMGGHCRAVTGVDVSRPMLAQARSLAPDAALSTDIPDGPFDWINSLVVFQHILPARGLALLERLLAVCAPDAALSLHVALRVPPPTPGEPGPGPDPGPDPGHVSLFAYDLPEVLGRLAGAGFASVHAEWLSMGEVHGVRLFSARGRYREA